MQEIVRRKIDEIREKPEHVRVMYVWGAVGVVMFFVLVIWIVTLEENFRKSAPEIEEFTETIRRPDVSERSIGDPDGVLGGMTEGIMGESGPAR